MCVLCALCQTEMRTFFRRYFTHNRYVSATATPLEALQLNQGLGGAGSVDLSSLYIDMRPYMNRSPFTVRRDCSASRVHQVRAQPHRGHAGCNQDEASVHSTAVATAGGMPEEAAVPVS